MVLHSERAQRTSQFQQKLFVRYKVVDVRSDGSDPSERGTKRRKAAILHDTDDVCLVSRVN